MLVLILLFLNNPVQAYNRGSPHTPYKITWKVYNLMTGEAANQTTIIGPINTTFPDLFLDLCDLVGEGWESSDQEPFPGYRCGHPGGRVKTRGLPLYICLGHP